MAHDFAKQRSNPDGKRKRAVSKGPPPGTASWSWFFSGLMTGVIVSIAAYLGVLNLEEGVAADAQTAQVGANPEEQPTYNFYQVLTNAEVPVKGPDARDSSATSAQASPSVDEAVSTVATPQSVASTSSERELYLLQAGSFQTQADAESRRARIILLNMNANVVEGIVQGRTRYRVQVGPFAGRQGADAARELLTGNAIESIVMKVPP